LGQRLERPKNSTQWCLVLNRNAGEMPAIEGGSIDLPLQQKHLLWLRN
jgi:hypothetical protein